MQRLLRKISTVTFAALLISTLAMSIAYALPDLGNSTLSLNTGHLQQLQKITQKIIKGNTQQFPIIIGGDNTPSTLPNRPCILVAPEYSNPNNEYDRWGIRRNWYDYVLNNFTGYIIDARDLNNDGRYSSFDFTTNIVDRFTRPLPQNSFNNFCFNAGQDTNPYVDDDGDGEFNEDPPGYGDEDGDGDTNEDGWPSQGFGSFGTLNLFEGNENGDAGIDSLDRTFPVVDERRFMVATKCDDPNSSTPNVNEAYNANDVTCNGQFTSLKDYHALIDEVDVKVGDVLRFGVYVHNNALYPDNPNAIAEDVLLQFDTKTNPNNPRAAISSDDNVYHQNPYDTGSPTLRDTFDLDNDGNTTEILRMATDTTKVNSIVPIELTPIEGATWLYNKTVKATAPNNNNTYHVPYRITTGSTSTIQDYGTPPSTPFTITFNPYINEEDHELQIDQVPGCFEFDGWYFFDYRVEAAEAPLCDELDIQWMQQWPTYEALPVIEDEFIPPADGFPPVPISFSDATDEGLYVIGETSVPLIVQVNRNGYEGDLIWELLIADATGNLIAYQPPVEHFCSNVVFGMQQDTCISGTVLSENNSGVIFNRFVSNTNSTLGSAYQQDTYKVYNLNPNVVLHIYADTGGDKISTCREAVFMPLCTDMTLVTPVTVADMTLDITTGMEIEVDTVPDYYNGPIVFSTDNQCGVFDIDDLGGDFADDANPMLNPLTNLYEVTVDFGVNDPKVAWYNIDTSEPGCSNETGEGDTITVNAKTDKGGRCAVEFSVTEEEVPQCIDVELTIPNGDVYLDDGTTAIDAEIVVNAEPGWSGTVQVWICEDPSSFINCLLSMDAGATVNGAPQPFAITASNGDVIQVTIDNISIPPEQFIYVNTPGWALICNDDQGVEWCGDGIINDGEDCDANDPNTPECNDECEFPEAPGECTDVVVTSVPDPIYMEDSSTSVDMTIDVTGDPTWTGSISTMVCPAAFSNNYALCFAFRDFGVNITNLVLTPPGPATFISFGQLNVGPLGDGQQITYTMNNISDPSDIVAVFTFPDAPQCGDSVPFEYCGDGIVNDGEECDPADPTTPECNDECEFPEGPFECTEVNLTTVPTPVYLEDSSTAFDTVIDVVADTAWPGDEIEIMVCSTPFTQASCQSSLDASAEINVTSSPVGALVTNDGSNDVTVDPVLNGDQISATVTNIDDPSNTIAAFVTNEPFCEDSADFEYCGDGIVNDGEECDPNNPLTPECTEECELPEEPEPFCGDGVLDSDGIDDVPNNADDEFCDDGNNLDGDGCSATCDDEIVIPPLCGDGIVDADGVDGIPGNTDDEECDDGVNNGNGPSACRPDCSLPFCGDGVQDLTEDCDDGALNGTDDSECSLSCELPGPPGPTGGDTVCTDLNILSESQINSIPAFILIETEPGYWGETNTATFNYTSDNPNGIFSSNDGIGTGGFHNTNDKSVLYTGNIGDTISVADTVHFIACSDSVTLTQGPGVPGDEDDDDDDGGEDGGGGDDDGGEDGGGDSCPGLSIINPSPKILTASEGYIEIVSPSAGVFGNGGPEVDGDYRYHTVGDNVKFVDTETLAGATAVQQYLTIGTPIPSSVWSNDLITESKEVFYFDADMSLDITVIVTDTLWASPNCGDTIQNSFTAITGPQIEKFGWIHETGGNTTDNIVREVNYQISYWNSRTNPDDPNSFPTSVVIYDTINDTSVGGHPGIYGVLDDGSENTTDYVLYDYEDLSRPEKFTTNFVDKDIHDANGDVVIRYYENKPSVHWLQEGNFNTWGGDENQMPNCDDPIYEPVPATEENPNPPTPPTHGEEGNLCFTGRIDTAAGITVNNMTETTVFELEYQGHIYTTNFCNNPANPSFTESFHNMATGTYTNYLGDTEVISDNETLYGTCKYLLTRNAGDVLFFTDSDPGANLAALTEDQTRNSDGLVFINKALDFLDTVFGGGVGGSVTANKCDDPSPNNLIPHMLSSFICQVYYDPYATYDPWKPSKINQKTDFDFLEGYEVSGTYQQIGDLDDMTLENFTNPTGTPGTRSKVYKFDGNVRIGASSTNPATLELEGGAKTIIINGDLMINSDIVYPDDTDGPDHELSSIAFIVTGNIYINSYVQNLAGVYVSRGGEFRHSGGTVTSNFQLVIDGSIFGDLQPLIDNRLFIGAPVLDGGNVVIRYSDRALRNTPPGLKDAIDLTWLRVAR